MLLAFNNTACLSECAFTINNGSPLFLRAGQAFSTNETDWKITSFKIKEKGINAIDTICGVAGFHTSYLKAVHKEAAKYGVNPLQLIEEYCKYDKVNMDEKLLSGIAQGLNKDIESVVNTNFVNYFGCEQK